LVVIVNGTALAAVPAQAQNLHVRRTVNQVASIVKIAKHAKVGHVADAYVKRVNQANQLRLGDALAEAPETLDEPSERGAKTMTALPIDQNGGSHGSLPKSISETRNGVGGV
jgi:hypothetical protein